MGGSSSRSNQLQGVITATGADATEGGLKGGDIVHRPATAQTIGSFPPDDDDNMDDLTDAALAEGDGPDLGSLKVKDPDAWRGNPTTRPRSALKHGSSAHDADPSRRKVAFKVNGLAPPAEVEGEQVHKRVRGSEEFSMRYLVEKFYGKVTVQPELRPFFEGVDMLKLKHQQEALFLLVFGGQELLDDELPGLSADLRLIHLHLLFEGLNLQHWQRFADLFAETLDECPQIPADVRARAKETMATTAHFFRPIEPDEWPPKVVYRGWTKRTCPFVAKPSPAARATPDQEEVPEFDFSCGGSVPAAAAALADTLDKAEGASSGEPVLQAGGEGAATTGGSGPALLATAFVPGETSG